MLGRFPAHIHGITSLPVLALCGIIHCHAQSISLASDVAPSGHPVPVERLAAEKLCTWQKRLNLQAWDISVLLTRANGMRPNTVGNIRWDNDKKTAVIRILDPVDYRLPSDAMLRDIEFTIVHELIHLVMAPVLADLHRTEANRLDEEVAVNHMAGALLKLDRLDATAPTGN